MIRIWKGNWVWSKIVRYFRMVISRWRSHYFHDYTIENIGFRGKLLLAVLEIVDWQGHLEDGGEKYGTFVCTRFLEHIKLIFISQSQMLLCLMDLWTYILIVNFWKFIIQMFQFCVDWNTLYPYFSMMFPKPQLRIRLFQLIR